MSLSTNFWKIAPCLFAIIIDFMGLGLVYPLVTVIFTETPNVVFPGLEGISERNFIMSLSYVLYPLFMFFGASLLGDLSDIYGRKKVLICSLVGILISLVAMGAGISIHSLGLFLIGRALSGLMAGSQPLCMAAIADLSTEATKMRNMGVVTLTNCLGFTFGPFLGGVLTERHLLQTFGFSLPLWVGAALAIVGIFWLFFFQETVHRNEPKKLDFKRPIVIFIEAFQHPKMRVFASVAFLQMFAFMLYYQTVGIYLREAFHYSSEELGFYYAAMGIYAALGVLLIIPIVLKKWHIEKIAAYGFLFNGIAALATVFDSGEFFVLAIALPFIVGNSVGYTAFASAVSNSTDERRQGWAMGVLAAAVALALTLSGFGANLLSLLSTTQVIALTGVSGILSGLLMIRYTLQHRRNT